MFSETVNRIARSFWGALERSVSPQLQTVQRSFPNIFEKATQFITNGGHSFVIASNHLRHINKIFGEKVNKKRAQGRRQMLSRILEHDRSIEMDQRRVQLVELGREWQEARVQAKESVEARKRADALESELETIVTPDVMERIKGGEDPAATLTVNRYRKLTGEDRFAVQNDAQVQQALQYYRDTIMKEWLADAESAGIMGRIGTGEFGTYHHARWFRQAKDLPKELRDTKPRLQVGVPGIRQPTAALKLRAKAARKATGAVPEGLVYEDALFHQILNTYTDRLFAKTERALWDAVRAERVTASEGGLIPLRTKDGFKVTNVTLLKKRGKDGLEIDKVSVPEPVAKAYNRAIGVGNTANLKALNRLSNLATAQVVILPAEATMHGMGVLFALGNLPPIAKTFVGRGIETFAPVYGKLALALKRGTELEGPRLEKLLKDMSEAAALRLTNFEGAPFAKSFVSNIDKSIQRLIGKVPVIGKPLAKVTGAVLSPITQLKDFVFGHPGTNKGLWGLETRLRAIAWETMKAADPSLSNFDLGRLVNDQFGTYVTKLAPNFAEAMRPFYPFARARTALTKTGLRFVGGFNSLGRYDWRIHTNLVTTAASLALITKMIDDDKRWPWEVPGFNGKSLLLKIGGRTVGIPMRNVFQPLQRTLTATGAGSFVRDFTRKEVDVDQMGVNYIREFFNFGLSWLGPLASSAFVLGTGSAPFVTEGGLLPLERKALSGSIAGKVKTRAIAAFKQAIPLIGKTAKDMEGAVKVVPRNQMLRAVYTVADIFGFAPFLGDEYFEERQETTVQRRFNREWRPMALQIAFEARNQPIEERPAFIIEQVRLRGRDDVLVTTNRGVQPASAAMMQLAFSASLVPQKGLAKAGALQEQFGQ